jgi:methylated-DNA-[protein]-cysteine S-methyltransferase
VRDPLETTSYTYMESPVGRLLLAGHDTGLSRVDFSERGGRAPRDGWHPAEAPFREAIRQLTAYFEGRLRAFDFPVAPEGTPFQLAVWNALREIPYGETVSYAEMARRMGQPRAVRAVGAANGRNPLPIVIPCHRLIGSDGRLTGYGGGLHVKEALLALERRGRTSPRA